eukprot:758830-Hanusia_phi.AAC.1
MSACFLGVFPMFVVEDQCDFVPPNALCSCCYHNFLFGCADMLPPCLYTLPLPLPYPVYTLPTPTPSKVYPHPPYPSNAPLHPPH